MVEPFESGPIEPDLPVVERTIVRFDTREEAEAAVQLFWRAMPHGSGIERDAQGDWTQELTQGDRTRILVGRIGADKGKWIVSFLGNHQPLTKQAVHWLHEQGYLAADRSA